MNVWHESELSTYCEHDDVDKDYAQQSSYFDGVPAALAALVRKRPETTESINIESGMGDRIHLATGVFWYDGTRWHVAEGLVEHCRRNGIDLCAQSGLSTIGPCLLGQEFTPERYFAHMGYDEGHSEKEQRALMESIRAAFARHV